MTLLVEFLVAAEIEASQAIDWYEAQETGLGSVLRKSIEAVYLQSKETHSHVRSCTVPLFAEK
jgi:phosphopantetheine adenylyltransferase